RISVRRLVLRALTSKRRSSRPAGAVSVSASVTRRLPLVPQHNAGGRQLKGSRAVLSGTGRRADRGLRLPHGDAPGLTVSRPCGGKYFLMGSGAFLLLSRCLEKELHCKFERGAVRRSDE